MKTKIARIIFDNPGYFVCGETRHNLESAIECARKYGYKRVKVDFGDVVKTMSI